MKVRSFNPANAVKLKKSPRYKKPKSYPTYKHCDRKYELDKTHSPAYGRTCC